MIVDPDTQNNAQRHPEASLSPLRAIGVVGAGTMGIGLAQQLAQDGLRTLLIDVADTILDAAISRVRNNIRFQGLFHKREDASPDEVLSRIDCSTSYAILSQADFVIENITEKMTAKTEAYAQMDAICPPHCIFAANTSAIPISRIAAMTSRPTQVLGMHFMNPVPLKDAVEVVRTPQTSEQTLQTACRLLAIMKKKAILVKDSPGFVSNRVLMLTINEAIFLLQEDVATAQVVDSVFKSCFGHKMGPLETADLIGLDTILFSLDVLHQELQDSKFLPCPLLKEMVAAGRLGRKSGSGFYPYADADSKA
jgi:3-hydroxybutyryl-CoA dehydrogenase